jgi:hypothetical protein
VGMGLEKIVSSSNNENCYQCYAQIEKKDRVALQCQHVFHKKCLSGFERENSCPLCLKKIEVCGCTTKQAIASVAFFVLTYSLFPSPFH